MKFLHERRSIFTLIISVLVMACMVAERVPVYAMNSGARIVANGKAENPTWREFIHLATVCTNAGRAWLTAKVDESLSTTGDYIGWGTGAGTAVVGGTALNTEDSGGSPAYARVTATRSIVTTSVTNDTVQWVGTLTSNGSKTITNAANFTASTSGTMIVHGDFTGVALALNDSIQFTIKLQFA